MVEQSSVETGNDWNRFIRKHRVAFAVFIVAAVLAAAGAVYVFVWFVGNAQAVGLVPSALSQWSMGHMVTFMLHAIFWELVLIGIPVAVGAIIGWQWYRRLPDKNVYKLSGKRSKSSGAGGGFSFFLFIVFAIKVYLDGNWGVPVASWTVDYVVGSMVTILIWIVAIAAIPAIAGLVWWLSRGIKQQP